MITFGEYYINENSLSCAFIQEEGMIGRRGERTVPQLNTITVLKISIANTIIFTLLHTLLEVLESCFFI